MRHVKGSKWASSYYLPALEYISAPADMKRRMLETVKGRASRKKITAPSFSVQRGKVDDGEWSYEGGNSLDALKLKVSAPICLTGIAVWTPLSTHSPNACTLKIYEGKSRLLYKSKHHKLTASTTEMQTLPIDPPLVMNNFTFYHISARIRGSHSGCTLSGETKVTSRDIEFSFLDPDDDFEGFNKHENNSTNSTDGQFPVLYFRKI